MSDLIDAVEADRALAATLWILSVLLTEVGAR
jgi:hypothetical protein